MFQIKTRTATLNAGLATVISFGARCSSQDAASARITFPHGAKTRTLAAISQARKVRRGPSDWTALCVGARLNAYLLRICQEQIDARNLSAPAGWDTFPKTVTRDPSTGIFLVTGSGWFEYSSRVGSYYQSAAYLCGKDGGQRWAVRVPSTLDSVSGALAWLTPKPIRDAQASGIPVFRQGDMWFRPMRISAHDLAALAGTRHTASLSADGSVSIAHPEHDGLTLPAGHRWRAYASTQIASSGRRAAD